MGVIATLGSRFSTRRSIKVKTEVGVDKYREFRTLGGGSDRKEEQQKPL